MLARWSTNIFMDGTLYIDCHRDALTFPFIWTQRLCLWAEVCSTDIQWCIIHDQINKQTIIIWEPLRQKQINFSSSLRLYKSIGGRHYPCVQSLCVGALLAHSQLLVWLCNAEVRWHLQGKPVTCGCVEGESQSSVIR